VIAFTADGMAYEKRAKCVIPYEGDSLRFAYLSYRGPVVQWPEWAIRHVNTLMREGFAFEKALSLVRREVGSER
jgi:hypothetical protein